eukprot:jgi/Mesvir1/7430/Mv19211-RA.2
MAAHWAWSGGVVCHARCHGSSQHGCRIHHRRWCCTAGSPAPNLPPLPLPLALLMQRSPWPSLAALSLLAVPLCGVPCARTHTHTHTLYAHTNPCVLAQLPPPPIPHPPGRERDGRFFDIELVESRLKNLRSVMSRNNIVELEYHLRAHLIRNLGNVCNPELYRSRLVAPKVIREYLHEVNFQLKYICNYDQPDLTLEQKLVFMQETRHAFGRTALLLSGGATLGLFHLGVVKTLVYHRILPRVVAGSSAGSIISSFIATKTDDELEAFFQQPLPEMKFFTEVGSLVRFAIRWLRYGRLHDVSVLRKQLRDLIGDYTFQEAYDLSGRILGVSISSVRPHEPPMLLNYLTSPHVIIWSAVCASCSFPGLFEAQELVAKDPAGKWIPYHWERSTMVGRRWRDGSLEEDLPFLRVKELFNVNHFIVSQANPHIAPFLRLKELIYEYGGKTARKAMHLLELEVKHRLKQALEMGIGGKGMSSLWSQEWEGDITIVMPATWEQMRKVIANPTREDVMSAVLQGERLAWGKVSSIIANCSIEMTLDECVQELRARKKAQQHQLVGTFMRQLDKDSRIPSWNTLARPASSDSMASSSDEGSSHSGRSRPQEPAPKGLSAPTKAHAAHEAARARVKKRRVRHKEGAVFPSAARKGGEPPVGVFDVMSPVDSGSPRAVPPPLVSALPAGLLSTPWPSNQMLSTQEEEETPPLPADGPPARTSGDKSGGPLAELYDREGLDGSVGPLHGLDGGPQGRVMGHVHSQEGEECI